MSEIREFIEKAKRFLRTAKLALDDGDYDSCISRCYYAMFIIAEAVLSTKNIEPKSHPCILVNF